MNAIRPLQKFWNRSTRCALALSAIAFAGLYSTPMFAQCGSLGSPSTAWTGATGNFGDATWDGGVPNGSTNTCIVNGTVGTPSVVNLSGTGGAVLSLEVDANNTLNVSSNATLTTNGTQILNGGAINVNGGAGTNAFLTLANSATLSGAGTLTLATASGGGNAYLTGGGGVTLSNSSTIQGTGYIGDSGMAVINSGTINANDPTGSGFLTMNGGGGVTNTGLLEATNGGILNLQNTTNNSSGNITADGTGSGVVISAAIQGGQLNTVAGGAIYTINGAVLDGVTNGALTISSGSTITAASNNSTNIVGQINNNGNIQINGGFGQNDYLTLSGNATFSGGSVTLSTASGGGNAYVNGAGGTTLTSSGTIQGTGYIGSSGLAVINSGTVNANSSAGSGSLTMNGGGAVTNTGLLEATNGGALYLQNTVVNSGGNITADGTGGSSAVLIQAAIQGGQLNTVAGGAIYTYGGAVLDGSTAQGALTISANSTVTVTNNEATTIAGSVVNNGTIQINGGNGQNGIIEIGGGVSSTTTLSGGGTLNLNTTTGGGSAFIEQCCGSQTLLNQDNTIQGAGVIGNGSMALTNNGIVNANIAAGTDGSTGILYLNGAGGIVNTSTLEATNGGQLAIQSTTVNNSGGNITAAAGSAVTLFNATIQGGTLNANAAGSGLSAASTVFDGYTQGALTLSNGSTLSLDNNNANYMVGSVVNNGTIAINGGNGDNGVLEVYSVTGSNNLTLTGGGTLTLSTVAGGGSAYLEQCCGGGQTLTNVDNTIQGSGTIGNNGLLLVNGATVNANVSGGGTAGTLVLNDNITNSNGASAGLLEATNGGTLAIQSNIVNNATGNITAGASSAVTLYNTTIQGGTLNVNTAGGGGMSAVATVFDGVTQGALTLSTGSTLNLTNNSTNYMVGSVVNNGTIAINGGNGQNGTLQVYSVAGGNGLALTGGGTVTLNTLPGGGSAFLEQCCGGQTLTNVDNTIQGSGVIGNNDLTLVNGATVNANVAGGGVSGTLEINGPITNSNGSSSGLLEATNGGTLSINNTTVNNANGNITAGTGSEVILSAITLQGGTLNTAGTGFMIATNTTTLDGVTQGAITLSTGSNLTLANNNTTYAAGTINNEGNITVNGGNGQNAYLQLSSIAGTSNLTLTGGGTLTLNDQPGGGTAAIYQCCGGQTLINVDNTIQGNGEIGLNGMSVTNQAAGTLLANVNGGTLLLDGSATLTNYGTMQANAGSLLHSTMSGFTNFSGNTLTGGTYNVYGTATSPGTIQINALGIGGGEIVNNAATILLNGVNSNIQDTNGSDALSAFANNLGAGSFTLANGRVFSTAVAFSNAGIVDIGSGLTDFVVASGDDYFQSAGTTQVDGSLTATTVTIDGGVLKGTGTVDGDVTVDDGGSVAPGDSPGILTVNGNYTQGTNGTLDIVIGGANAGTDYSVLDVDNTVTLSGALDLTSIGGFNPFAGETFDILNFGSGDLSGTFANATWANLTAGLNFTVEYNPTDVEVVVGGVTSATPEPSTWLLFAGALGALAAFQWKRKRSASLDR